MIAIVDYKIGNLQSVANAFEALGAEHCVTNEARDLRMADKIVLPGVGAFGEGMKNLGELKLLDTLREEVILKKKPFLGICLGMQILADRSYEHGCHQGLGWIPGEVCLIEAGELALPHMGWNDIEVLNPSPILENIGSGSDFYFVHSYCLRAADRSHVSASCVYGQEVAAVVSKENIFGVQFHPEKSQKAGKILMENFAKLS